MFIVCQYAKSIISYKLTHFREQVNFNVSDNNVNLCEQYNNK